MKRISLNQIRRRLTAVLAGTVMAGSVWSHAALLPAYAGQETSEALTGEITPSEGEMQSDAEGKAEAETQPDGLTQEKAAQEDGWKVPDGVKEIYRALLPGMAPYPNEESFIGEDGVFDSEGFQKVWDAWFADKTVRRGQAAGKADWVKTFLMKSAPVLLAGDDTENHVYSPLNIYLALGFLAELTEGESREQILSVLGTADIEELRGIVDALWNGNYSQDGSVTLIPGASLWVNESMDFDEDVLQKAAQAAFASIYEGDVKDPAMTEALRSWISWQTNGLLDREAGSLELDPQTILSLVTTIYFKAPWGTAFVEAMTADDIFHAPEEDLTVPFMHEGFAGLYMYGEKFGAVEKQFSEDGSMLLVLPDEGTKPEELLENEEFWRLICGGGDAVGQANRMILLSMPRLDVSADLDLIEGLKKLGISDVFVPGKAGFIGLGENAGDAVIGTVKHAARVKADEEGVEAAAFTSMMLLGAGMPPEENVEFRLDRPFIFVIKGVAGTPLFFGVVNMPQESR